ncbi:hypothetical protein FHG87_013992, partial [Trinorchestia longiramus]
SPVSLFFPPRTWSTSTAGLRPHLTLPPLTPLSSLTFSASQQQQQGTTLNTSHHQQQHHQHASLTAAAAAALRQRIVRPSHRPAHCPACGRYFTFGHNMKAHLKRCPKNANRVVTTSNSTTTALSSAMTNVLRTTSPSRRYNLSPPTLLRTSSPPPGLRLPLRLPISPPALPLIASAFNNHKLDASPTPSSPSPPSNVT